MLRALSAMSLLLALLSGGVGAPVSHQGARSRMLRNAHASHMQRQESMSVESNGDVEVSLISAMGKQHASEDEVSFISAMGKQNASVDEAKCYATPAIGKRCNELQQIGYAVGVTESACQSLCNENPSCKGVDYYPSYVMGACVLFSNVVCTPLRTSTAADARHSQVVPCEAAAPYVQVHRNSGSKAVCNEGSRVQANCGDCGPNWGDLTACKLLCDGASNCRFITFFSDNGCRLYSDCTNTWNHGWDPSTSIYQKQAAPTAACVDQTFTGLQIRACQSCDARPASCRELEPHCNRVATQPGINDGEGVRRVCPFTCGVCPTAYLVPGALVALHNSFHNRFVRMNQNADMDTNEIKASNQLPSGWSWERFTVVDAGNGQIALHNSVHNQFVRMTQNEDMDASGVMAANQLPSGWSWERFTVVDAGNRQIALHNSFHNRFVRMTQNAGMDASGVKAANQLPSGWSWERFTVVTG